MKLRAGYENGEDQLQQTDAKLRRKDKNCKKACIKSSQDEQSTTHFETYNSN